MGSGFAKMRKQAKQMENQMQMLKEEMKNQSIEGQSGNGLVSVIIDGEKTLKKISIKPECVDPSDVEGLEDLILAAFLDASQKAESNSGIPSGFSLPF